MFKLNYLWISQLWFIDLFDFRRLKNQKNKDLSNLIYINILLYDQRNIYYFGILYFIFYILFYYKY